MGQTIEKSLSFEPILKEKVKQILVNKADKDVHQAIMDVAYQEYEAYLKDINKQLESEGRYLIKWAYSGLCEWVRHQLGDLAKFAVLIGKYNQQVENGGHYQYWQNNYGSVNDHYKDLYLHIHLIQYFEENLLKEITSLYKEDQIMNITSTLGQVLDILKQLPEKIEWPIEIEYAGFDSDGELEYKDSGESYQGISDWSYKQLDYLDNQYYKVNEALMGIINQYFTNYLFTDEEI